MWRCQRQAASGFFYHWRRIWRASDNKFTDMEGALWELRMPDERTEQEQMLRRKVLAGDQTAWRTLYDGAFAALWAYVSWRCAGQRDLAEEMTQETWLVAVRRLADFDPAQASFITWLRGIAAHLLQNAVRLRQRRREQQLGTTEELAATGEGPSTHEQAELIAEVLTELPPRYEAVLRAKYLDRASVEQIAADWQETPKAIESLLSRARQAFRFAYEKRMASDVLTREEQP